MQRSGSGSTRRDLAAKVPFFVNTNTKLWVGFEDKQSVRDKVTIQGTLHFECIWKYKTQLNRLFGLEHNLLLTFRI